jgi:hypothetical protein
MITRLGEKNNKNEINLGLLALISSMLGMKYTSRMTGILRPTI